MRAPRYILAATLAFATCAAALAQNMGNEKQRAEGRELYDKYCAQCHGLEGDGQGYATLRVKPQPRDFTSGKFKFRTTPNGMLPTDADIERIIKVGLPYTSMPGWPMFTDQQVRNIVYYLKTFSEDFQIPEKAAEPIDIPTPPQLTDESIARGREVYEAQGCAACHGQLGRGNGPSAATLKDDWGQHIRPADMTMPWTYRGGATRQDIYRTFSTGLNGTPMPSYWDSLQEQDRWDLTNYVYSLSEGGSDPSDPDYANLLLVDFVDDDLDPAEADTLFEGVPVARFPLVGQIMEPGRNFYPSATSVQVQGIYNRQEVLFRLRWNDMRAETSGANGPTLEVPLWDEELAALGAGAEAEADSDDIWGDALEEDVGDDIWGDALEEDDAGDDFWDEEDGGGAEAAGEDFSDAVAIQLPSQLPTGIVKPYFIFGDLEKSVDIWFVDLAEGERAQQYVGRGSESLTPAETDDIEVTSSYDDGEWTVLFKRQLRSNSNVSFKQGTYMPIAFSIWDGFNRERGNKRALSSWMYLYVQPAEELSPVGPMVKAAVGTLVVELIVVVLLYRRFGPRRAKPATVGGMVPQRG